MSAGQNGHDRTHSLRSGSGRVRCPSGVSEGRKKVSEPHMNASDPQYNTSRPDLVRRSIGSDVEIALALIQQYGASPSIAQCCLYDGMRVSDTIRKLFVVRLDHFRISSVRALCRAIVDEGDQ